MYKTNKNRGEFVWEENDIFEILKNIYYGDEIIKMIRNGELKENDKLIGKRTGLYDTEFIVKKDDNGVFYIREFNSNDKDKEADSWDLINMIFEIKRKKYFTFDEARKSGKKFKHRGWNTDYLNIEEIFKFIGTVSFRKVITQQLDDKVWEIED